MSLNGEVYTKFSSFLGGEGVHMDNFFALYIHNSLEIYLMYPQANENKNKW